jgi:hypothetical protein
LDLRHNHGRVGEDPHGRLEEETCRHPPVSYRLVLHLYHQPKKVNFLDIYKQKKVLAL